MQNLIGQTINNRYRVDQFLGRGGMAEVYKVWDERRASFLAMKMLHEDLALDRVFIKRFKREGQTLSRLQHPNIVRYYGLVQDGRRAFMLLDYVEGETLKHKIFDANGPMSFNDIREVSRAVCSALQFAHREGLIHCDIKPANIMINQHGKVLLSDFGIARLQDGATATMVGAGTPAYMAPEQAAGQNPVPQSDIYALGIVLYEMLTGDRPFIGERAQITGTSSELVRWEQINIDPLPPSSINTVIPTAIDQVVLKCLKKEPSQRYQSPLDLLNDLEQGLTSVHQKDAGLDTKPTFIPSPKPSPDPQPVFHPKKGEESKITPPWLLPVVISAGLTIIVVLWILARIPDNPFSRSATPTSYTEVGQDTSVEIVDQAEQSANNESYDPPPPSTTPVYDPEVYFPLSNCAGSRTRVGDSIYISFDGGWNALREDPDVGSDDNIIGRADEGEVLQIVGGPKCSLGWILWQVETETMLKAWTPESDGEEFWFEIIDTRKVCSGYPKSRLHKGDYGHVAVEPSQSNRVRVDPNSSADVLGSLQPGEGFKILNGPECASGWVWWYVRSVKTGLTGWTAEGTSAEYWLVPDPEQ